MGTGHTGRGISGRLLAAAAMLAWLGMAAPAQAASDNRQYKVEAVFLYNFLNYITWPGYGSPAELREATICLIGNDPLATYLQYVQQKMVAERKLVIRSLRGGQAASGCHILFDRTGTATPPTDSSEATLTVSDEKRYVERGGMIALSHSGGRVGIDINHTLLTRQGFQVSSRLLKLAEEVHGRRTPHQELSHRAASPPCRSASSWWWSWSG